MSTPDTLSPERWAQVLEHFHAAADLSPSKRSTYLDEACPDAALRRQVDLLLAADADAAQMLRTGGVGGPALRIDRDDATGAEVGPYRLHDEIGRGGMGVVYHATRTDVGTTVAVKMLRERFPSADRLRRFLTEQQVLGRLDHPGIARFLDAGVTGDGTPFFAMEYVEGTPITEACAGRPLHERLRLFLDACEAVQYAHGQLVVHRDLKPSNVLVTADGEVTLLDFGISKLLDADATLTGSGDQPMTPAYAAPEQVGTGEVSTATDVYGLGALLYELLAGVRPLDLDGTDLRETIRRITEATPEAPSLRTRDVSSARLRGDLDTICLKALRKEPARRYATVEALRDDVERYLTDRPVAARPDSLSYRARKFAARNRAGLFASLAVVLLLGAMLVVHTSRLSDERDRAQTEAERAREVTSFVTGLFEAARPEDAATDTLRALTLLSRGRASIERMDDQPARQAQLLTVIGGVYRDLGRLEEAESVLKQAAERHPVSETPSPDRIRTHRTLGLTIMDRARFDEAHTWLQNALDANRTISDAAPVELAQSTQAMGFWAYATGDYEQSAALSREALTLRTQHLDAGHPDVIRSHRALASALAGLGRADDAESSYRTALRLARASDASSRKLQADVMQDLASLLHDREQFDEAETLHRQALKIRQRVLGEDHPLTAVSLSQLSTTMFKMERYDEARDFAEAAVAVRERVFGPDHESTATALNQLALVYSKIGMPDSSIAIYERNAEIYATYYHPRHQYVGVMKGNAGSTYTEMGRYEDAVDLLRESYEISADSYGPDHWQTAYAGAHLLQPLRKTGRYEEAERHLKHSYRVLSGVMDADSPSIRVVSKLGVRLYAVWQNPDVAQTFVDSVATHGVPRADLDSLVQVYREADAEAPLAGRTADGNAP